MTTGGGRSPDARYRLLFERNVSGVYRSTPDGRMLECNEAFAHILGYADPAEACAVPATAFHHAPGSRHDFLARLEATGSLTNLELEARGKDGRIVWLLENAILSSDDGEPVIEGTVVDISDRKRAEDALRRSEERYRTLFLRNLAGVFRSTMSGQVLEANEACARIFGCATPEEFLQLNAVELYEKPEARKRLFERLAREKMIRNLELTLKRRDGTDVCILANLSLVESESGGEPVMAGTIFDMTDRKEAEEALKLAHLRQQALMNNIPDAAWMKDLESRFLAVNEPLARAAGSTVEAMIGRTDLDFFPADRAGRSQSDDRRVVERGERVRVVEQVADANGIRWVETIRTPIRDAQGRTIGSAGIARDVTERHRAEEERSQLARQLAQSQKMEAVGQLAGGIAHDFNNLLTAIAGYSDLLIGSLPPDDPRRAHAVEIQRAGDRAASLTRQLLAFSRRQMLEPKVLDLNAVVESMEKMLQRVIGEHIRLTTRKAADLGNVRADPGQIEQAVMNLVVNARDAMPSGGSLEIATESVAVRELPGRDAVPVAPGAYCAVSVTDTGTGMSADVKARLFEPFFTTKGLGKGTGLGLSTTYGIVKQSGGYILCDSEPGRGSSFRILLPRVDQPVASAEPEPPPAVPGRRHERILLVEDEPEVRRLVEKLLKIQGYEVFSAATPEEALSIDRHLEEAADLMITDVVMPGMSGRDLADRLSGIRPHMRVLFVSGYTDNAIVHQGVLEPGTAFLQKPFTPAALGRKIREILDGRVSSKPGA